MIRFLPLLVLFLCLSGVVSAQNVDTIRRRDPGGWEFVQAVRGKVIVTEGATHNGIREGNWVEYWENKIPHTVTSYRNGRKDGIYIEIRRTGQIELEQS